MKINEIFYSIQGEGAWSGKPNIFLRTAGCNLRCTYCDTTYAYLKGTEMTLSQIMTVLQKYPCKNICITGGEPLLQKELLTLVNRLLKKKYCICLETNGSCSIKRFTGKPGLLLSLDIKCPTSGMHKKMKFTNINYLTNKDQLKFIIKNKQDYYYAKKLLTTYTPKYPVFFQPVWGTDPKKLANWILTDGLNVHLGVQLHKILWGKKRGV
jgi:7-carboxy-7-deazaguanine synthase